MPDRIGLFGGTFDPVHAGHVAIVESFLESGLIDELWVIPAPTPPHKTDQHITSFEHRKRMLEQAFDHIKGVRITDIEERLPQPSYTIHTIQYLKQKYPEKKFYLCIGEDSLADFSSWYKPEKIVQICDLLVAERPDSNSRDQQNNFLENARFVKHTPVDISSTELRERLKEDGKSLEKDLPPDVLSYIRDNDLYND
ncbi:nicotinate (nicotinamide) nucleotide adenylyltransferase [Halalkalibaculum sp. DA3122]|uniref:nicotinate (nicotinamide) nucleotide adenylyltransferase n=1 Tax=unclassified Halalkalibaculum TaxID=2964617 RepID=UPI003754C36F